MTRAEALAALVFLTLLSWGGSSPASSSTAIPDEVTRLRDPFKRPLAARGKSAPKSDLELYALDKFKLVAVVTGPVRLRAMVEAPNGRSYFVWENMRIGLRKGIVRRITPDAVHVREQVINVLGQEESVDSEIRMNEPNELGGTTGTVSGGSVSVSGGGGSGEPGSATTEAKASPSESPSPSAIVRSSGNGAAAPGGAAPGSVIPGQPSGPGGGAAAAPGANGAAAAAPGANGAAVN